GRSASSRRKGRRLDRSRWAATHVIGGTAAGRGTMRNHHHTALRGWMMAVAAVLAGGVLAQTQPIEELGRTSPEGLTAEAVGVRAGHELRRAGFGREPPRRCGSGGSGLGAIPAAAHRHGALFAPEYGYPNLVWGIARRDAGAGRHPGSHADGGGEPLLSPGPG